MKNYRKPSACKGFYRFLMSLNYVADLLFGMCQIRSDSLSDIGTDIEPE